VASTAAPEAMHRATHTNGGRTRASAPAATRGQHQLGAKTGFGPKSHDNPARRVGKPLHKRLIFHVFVRICIQANSRPITPMSTTRIVKYDS
jgi:hypothetical protein